MKPDDFDLFVTIVKQRSGLVLTREKAYLLESRLLPVVRKYSLKTLEDMAHAVRIQRDESMLSDITEAMLTNDSFFFRDRAPFADFQNKLLPQFLKSRAAHKKLRIWSAASSSGQEAYSLAMICAEEEAALQGWHVEIYGSDLSREMIERANDGIYSQFEVQRGLPIGMLVKYFQQLSVDKWQIKENIRERVQFHEGNLIQDFGPVGTFDIVFCRNVLVYFDPPTRTRVLEAISKVMAADGILILGGSESALGASDLFKAAGLEQGLYVMAEVNHVPARHLAV